MPNCIAATASRDRRGTETARAEMEINYFGLLRLAQASARRCARAPPTGTLPATAWVNILSIYALSTLPSQGTFSASKAAASRCRRRLRAEMRGAGIRVSTCFPARSTMNGTSWCRRRSSRPQRWRRRIVKALRDGVEDLYPGDVAQDLLTRWRESAKVLEREMWVNERRAPAKLLTEFADALADESCASSISRRRCRRAFRKSCCRRNSTNARRSAWRRSRATTSAGRPGTGTISRSANIPARISTRRCTGSPAATLPSNATDTLPPQSFHRAGLRGRLLGGSRARCGLPAHRRSSARLGTQHGRIAAGSWLLMRTDWSKRSDPVAYQNFDEAGQHTPGPDVAAVRFLVA